MLYPSRFFLCLTRVVPFPLRYTEKRFKNLWKRMQSILWLSLHYCSVVALTNGDLLISQRTILPTKVSLQSNSSKIEEKTLLTIPLLVTGNTRSQRTSDFMFPPQMFTQSS